MNLQAKKFIPNHPPKHPQSKLNPQALPYYPPQPHSIYSIATLNARSIQNKVKREDIVSSLMSEHQILTITETWLHFHIQNDFPNVNILQSGLGRHRQVAILTRPTMTSTPVYQDLWSDCFMIVRIDLKARVGSRSPFFLIAVYWPPGEWKKHLEILVAITKHCRSRDSNMEIVVTGDFNLPPKTMQEVTRQTNLHLAQEEPELPTHKNAANNKFNQLDYILSSANFMDTRCTQDNKWSDHNVLSSKIKISNRPTSTNKVNKMEIRLKKNLSIEDEKAILSHPDWPRRSYLQIAQVLGLTQRIKIKDSEDGGKKYLQRKQLKHLNEAVQKSDDLLTRYQQLPAEQQLQQQDKVLNELLELWKWGTARLKLLASVPPTSSFWIFKQSLKPNQTKACKPDVPFSKICETMPVKYFHYGCAKVRVRGFQFPIDFMIEQMQEKARVKDAIRKRDADKTRLRMKSKSGEYVCSMCWPPLKMTKRELRIHGPLIHGNRSTEYLRLKGVRNVDKWREVPTSYFNTTKTEARLCKVVKDKVVYKVQPVENGRRCSIDESEISQKIDEKILQWDSMEHDAEVAKQDQILEDELSGGLEEIRRHLAH